MASYCNHGFVRLALMYVVIDIVGVCLDSWTKLIT